MELNKKYTTNQKNLLKFINDNPLLTRSELAEKMGFSIVSIINFVNDFIKDNIVIEREPNKSKGGRRPVTITINPDYAYVLGLDIGAYSIKLGMIDMSGKIIYREEILNDIKNIPSKTIKISALLKKILILLDKFVRNKCLGLGIGISGIISYENKSVLFCPNISGWKNINIQNTFGDTLHLPVILDTSARWFSIAESKKNKEDEIIVAMLLGYSISAGIIVNKHVLRGAEGFAGEIGHLQVVENGSKCTCGSFGCIENYVTLPEIILRISKSFHKENLSVKEINILYKDNDIIVKNYFNEIILMLAKVVSDIIKLYNPDRIIMDGGVIKSFPYIIDLLNIYIKSNSFNFLSSNLLIEKTAIENDATLIGIGHEFIRLLLN